MDCHTRAHLRLEGLLLQDYEDWGNVKLEYICYRFTHPLAPTHWKAILELSIYDFVTASWEVESRFTHQGVRATMDHSMDDAAHGAWLNLHGRRHHVICNNNRNDHFLPYAHPTMGWAFKDPWEEDMVTVLNVGFNHDMMKKVERMKAMLARQERIIKGIKNQVDEQRVQSGLPKIYEVLKPVYKP